MSRKLLNQVLDQSLLQEARFQEALTHRSLGGQHNERLEFLGDSVLGVVITDWLFNQLPEADEGALSRIRSALVNKEALAEIAHELDLGNFIHLGPGELKSGGFRRDSILADTLEALVGAMYLVKGMDAVRDFIHQLYGERLHQLPDAELLKDPKSRLQELLQAKGLPVPSYDLVDVTGKAHKQHFKASCIIPAFDVMFQGEGGSRRKAEQACAAKALDALNNNEFSLSGGRK